MQESPTPCGRLGRPESRVYYISQCKKVPRTVFAYKGRHSLEKYYMYDLCNGVLYYRCTRSLTLYKPEQRSAQMRQTVGCNDEMSLSVTLRKYLEHIQLLMFYGHSTYCPYKVHCSPGFGFIKQNCVKCLQIWLFLSGAVKQFHCFDSLQQITHHSVIADIGR